MIKRYLYFYNNVIIQYRLMKKPILPKFYIQIASTNTSKIIPILFASVNSLQTEVTFSYGELMNITFESIVSLASYIYHKI